MQRRRRWVLPALLLLAGIAGAQAGDVTEARRFRDARGVLPFRIALPASYAPGDTVRYPLVVTLHGSDGGGWTTRNHSVHVSVL